jgi:phenylalanyl-tRNA synthetase beta chain
MDIKISNNWLKEYLKTTASSKEIADKLSLCGPSVERITKIGNDFIYDIEVTTNRVDCMSILGIAREASAILPNGKLIEHKSKVIKETSNKNLLKIKSDPKLVNRVMAVVMEVGDKISTPKLMKERLENSGMRSLNPIVDITNYVMQEIGHPTHVFDYDLLKDKQIMFRLSDKNEEIITFDGKTYKLSGGDVVIDDGEGNIIDLPGIIGLKNSVVEKDTKRIIFFIDNVDQFKIRKTSTRLGIRTNAAVLNEKGVDPELALMAFEKGIELYKEICKAKIISKIYDIYPRPYVSKTINVEHKFIEKIIGITLSLSKVNEILDKLGFETKYASKNGIYQVKVPSWRANDINIPEDIVEEIARIYGYYNLPSVIMTGKFSEPVLNSPFSFENKIKDILKGYGGIEIYSNSLVPKEYVKEQALKLKNPLGEDTRYLRTSLKQSMIAAVRENNGEKEPFYLFEIANIYIPKKNDLPTEKMTLGIIFANYDYRMAKGIIEALYDELNIDDKNFNLEIIPDYDYLFIEIETNVLQSKAKENPSYIPISKYPAQIEDLTIVLPKKTKIGDIMKIFKKAELVGVYENSYTFRVWYYDSNKTLTDKDVEKIRNKYLKEIKDKFGGVIKS